MNIVNATRRAFEEGKFITQPAMARDLVIEPSNDARGFILHSCDLHTPPGTGWQPTADDILAEDWEVVDGWKCTKAAEE